MKICVIAVGKRMPQWVAQGFGEYQRRMPPEMQMQLREIAQAKAGSAAENRLREGQAILEALPKKAYLVALDERGRELSSGELADELEGWAGSGKDIAIVIGGPDGLSDEVKGRADAIMSLSRLTLPHMLVRVFVAEAVYRAYGILHNLPYHRA